MKGRNGLDKLLMERQITKVDWESYEKIDAKEKDPSRPRTSNQPREKITSLHEMLQLICMGGMIVRIGKWKSKG